MNPTPRSPLLPPALVVGVLAVSFAAIFFVKAQPTDPLVAAGIRLAVAGTALLPLIVRARLRGLLPGSLIRSGLLAGLFYSVHFGAWVASLERTSIAASVTLVASTPLLLAVASLFTGRDRPSRGLWAAIALAAVGLTILGVGDLTSESGSLVGDGLALLGCAAMAGYLLLVRSAGPTLDPLVFSGMACITGAGILLGTALALGTSITVPSSEALGYLVLAALIPQLIGHVLLTWSLRHTTPTSVGLAVTCEPVVATALGVLLLSGTLPSPLAGLGCAVTVTAVFVALATQKRSAA